MLNEDDGCLVLFRSKNMPDGELPCLCLVPVPEPDGELPCLGVSQKLAPPAGWSVPWQLRPWLMRCNYASCPQNSGLEDRQRHTQEQKVASGSCQRLQCPRQLLSRLFDTLTLQINNDGVGHLLPQGRKSLLRLIRYTTKNTRLSLN